MATTVQPINASIATVTIRTTVTVVGGSSGIGEAPNDGQEWIRKNLGWALQSSHTIDASDVIPETLGSPAVYNNLAAQANASLSTGIITGLTISDGGSGTLDVAAGSGWIRNSASDVATIAVFDLVAVTGLVLTDLVINYIYIEYNGGVPQVVADTSERTDTNSNILIGNVNRSGSFLHLNEYRAFNVANATNLAIRRWLYTEPMAHESGCVIGETGTRNISISAGAFWEGVNRFITTAKDTSVADVFFEYYSDGAGGFTANYTATQINNTQYDDGSGTLATLGNNRYGVHWVYIGTDSDIYVLFGSDSYLLAATESAEAPSALPKHIQSHGRLIGRVIIQKDSTTFEAINSAFTTTFSASGVSSHLDLSEVGTNTHAQIDTHIADATVHFLMSAISLTESQISDLGNYITASGVTYEALSANSDIGAGATQVAQGNHGHTGMLVTADIGDTVQAYDANLQGTDTANSYSRIQYFAETTLTDQATIAWNTRQNQVTQVTLAANRTMGLPTNLNAGGFYSIYIIQDATGGRTIAWNAVFRFIGGVAPVLTTGASGVDHFVFRTDGTNLFEVGRSIGIATP